WGVRIAAIQVMNVDVPIEAAAIERAARVDPAFQVRLAAMRKKPTCSVLIDALNDRAEVPAVRLETLTLMRTNCAANDASTATMKSIAEQLRDPSSRTNWHEPVRALETLAKFDPASAIKLIWDVGMTHEVWQVRAAAARAALAAGDRAALIKFTA